LSCYYHLKDIKIITITYAPGAAVPDAPPADGPERGAIRWDSDADGWLVRSYSACRAIARDDGRRWQKVFRPGLNEPDLIEIWGAGSPSGITYVPDSATGNPPEHGRLHRWWMRALSPEAVEPHRAATIRPIVDRALDRLDGRTTADLDAELAQWIPIRVIAAIMGLPLNAGLLEECRRLVLAATSVRGMATGQRGVVPDESTAASAQLRELLLPFVRSRRDGTGTGFIGDLWRHAPQIFEPGWDELTIVANVRIMFQAGTRTTANGMANLLYILLTRPDVRAAVAARSPQPVAALVEESLRLYSPVYATLRRATADLVLEGVSIRRGDVALLLNQDVGTDAATHASPGELMLDRPHANRHMAFHLGARACTGQFLARVEMQELAAAVTARMPGMRVDPAAAVPPRQQRIGLHWAWRPLPAMLVG
jgi:cytochrome P450